MLRVPCSKVRLAQPPPPPPRMCATYFAAGGVRIFSNDFIVSPIRSFFTNGVRKNRSTMALKIAGSSYGTMCVAFGKIASWLLGIC